MHAISFDLKLRTPGAIHPRGFQQAYRDMERTLNPLRFRRVQQSVYVTERHDLGSVYLAIATRRGWNGFLKP